MLILHETYDHWSVAVLTVTVHSSFFPTFDFFKICCFLHWIESVNPHFLLPYIIMDLPIFNDFAKFSSLRINSDKTEDCGIGVKKGDSRALSGFKVVYLTCESILILGCHHSYNKKIATDRNFLTLVDNMQAVLNQWANSGLSLGGKVLVFKTLGISKMQYLAQMTLIPKHIIQKLIDIQEKFLWKNGKPKIKHSTLIADYKDGGLKVVDIDSKFRALKLTWLKRLCDDNEHPWKIIP